MKAPPTPRLSKLRRVLRVLNHRHRQAARATALMAVLVLGPATAARAQNIDLASFDSGATADGFAILGAITGDTLGWSVSGAGDVNGDGFADLIIGAHRADGPSDGRNDAGDSYVIFGKASGFANIDLATLDSGATADGFAILGALAGDSSGVGVSGAGDLNGDGFADLIIGAVNADGPSDGRDRAGDSYVIFGKALGFANIDLATLNSAATADGFAILGAFALDTSGVSVSGAGDVNGDGFADIIIGARFADGPSDGRSLAGDSYVIFGKASGFANIDLATLNSSATADGFAILGASGGDLAGCSVSGAGDVNGDGFADLIIGALQADGPSDGRDRAGDSYVIFGKALGFANIDLATLDSGATADGFAILGALALDTSGISVSGAGDVNGDGFADLIIGAYYADGPSDGRSRAGDSYVIFGKASGFTNIDLATLDSSDTADGFAVLGARTGDNSGRGVSGASDVNGDGFADLIIGATEADGPRDGRRSAGDSYVIFGKALGFANIDLAILDSGATEDGFAILGARSYDQSGSSVSGAGDVNGDGFADLFIGALWGDGTADERSQAGDSYVIFGKGTATKATYRAFAGSGDTTPLAIGITGDGSNDSTPDSRCWIDFDAGDNGSGGASLQTVTLARNNSALANVPAEAVARVHWQLTTDRTGWNSAEVTLKYTNAEVSALAEETLQLYTAADPDGPWTLLDSALDTRGNTLRAIVSQLGYLAIGGEVLLATGVVVR